MAISALKPFTIIAAVIAKKEADIAIVYVRGVVYVVLIRTGAKETVRDVRTCGFTRRNIG